MLPTGFVRGVLALLIGMTLGFATNGTVAALHTYLGY